MFRWGVLEIGWWGDWDAGEMGPPRGSADNYGFSYLKYLKQKLLVGLSPWGDFRGVAVVLNFEYWLLRQFEQNSRVTNVEFWNLGTQIKEIVIILKIGFTWLSLRAQSRTIEGFLHRATPRFFEVDCVERDTPSSKLCTLHLNRVLFRVWSWFLKL